ncbi:MAG TPA: hypothetical protein VF821_00220, partial [Lentzea sp.]
MRERRPVSLPDNLKHLQEHAKHTKAGLSLHEGAARGRDRFKSTAASATTVAPDPHRYTVDIHGSADNVRVGDTKLTPKDLADIIRATGDWDGKQPIRLLSCQTGNDPNGFAAHLSKELGVEVVAPIKDAWVDDMGNVFASSSHHDPVRGDSSPGWPPNGDWTTFKPDGTSTKHDRPVPPGATPTWGSDVPEKRPLAWRRGEPTRFYTDLNGVYHEIPPRNTTSPHNIRANEAPQWRPNQNYGNQPPPPQHRQPPPPGAPAPGLPQGQAPQRFPQHGQPQGNPQQQHHRPTGVDPRIAWAQGGPDPRHTQHNPDPRQGGYPQQRPHTGQQQHAGQQQQRPFAGQQQGHRPPPPGQQLPRTQPAPGHGPLQPRTTPPGPGQQPRQFQGPPQQQSFRQPPPQGAPNQQGMRPMPLRTDNPQVRHDVPTRPAPVQNTPPVPQRGPDPRPQFDHTPPAPVQHTTAPQYQWGPPPNTDTAPVRQNSLEAMYEAEKRQAFEDYKAAHPELAHLTDAQFQERFGHWELDANGNLVEPYSSPVRPKEPAWRKFQDWANDLF